MKNYMNKEVAKNEPIQLNEEFKCQGKDIQNKFYLGKCYCFLYFKNNPTIVIGSNSKIIFRFVY